MKHYSRRELYALGETLGESVTRNEAGRRVYGGGGGGIAAPAASAPTATAQTATPAPAAQPMQQPMPQMQQPMPQAFSQATNTPIGAAPGVAPQSQVETQSGLANYMQPYVNPMLGATMQQLFNFDQYGNMTGLAGYTPYSYDPADYFAAFTPLQEQAQSGLASLQGPWQGDYASGQMADYMNRAANLQYQPTDYGYSQVSAPQLRQYQMGPAERVGTQSFNQPGTAESFMSPYMQNVVNAQQREAKRQSAVQGQSIGAQAARSGAFGGARQAIMEAERQRNLATQLGDIQSQGLQSAFQNAQQQFNAEQQARLQAALANQQAGLTTGQQNLAAKLGIQQLGAGQNLQAQQLNQAAQQAANQLRAQQAQFGANYGLQGLQAAMSGAGQLGGLGNQGLQNQLAILNAQQQGGAQQQALQQQIINQAVQNYNTAQQYPYMQLGFMQNMMQGLPLAASSQATYQAAPSTVSQLAGLGMAGLGLGKLMGGFGGGTTGATGANPVSTGVNNAISGGITGLLNNAGSWIGNAASNAWDTVSSWLPFEEGGQVKGYDEDYTAEVEKLVAKNDPQGLVALALSKM